MFDLQDEKLTKLRHDTPIDRLEGTATSGEEAPEHPLDGPQGEERHRMLMSYYKQELDRQGVNRFEQAMDAAYYDNKQWTEEEKAELRSRGQAATVYNIIRTAIDWIIGSEKRGRTDFNILPRGKDDAKPAEAKTKFMKYLSDVNRTPFHRSRAFEDVAKVGIGWLEEGAQNDEDGEPIYARYESWRNMLWDSASTELDLSDARWVSRSKWVDEDIAKTLFPGRDHVIEAAVTEATLYGGGFDLADGDQAMDSIEYDRNNSTLNGEISTHSRRRVRLIEMWYRVPEKVKRLRGGAFSGEILDENDPRHAEAIEAGAVMIEKPMMRMRVAIMTTHGLLADGPSPYRHNRFKFVPIWGYRDDETNLPYSLIRGLRPIQDGVNKAKSKAQHILSTNKVLMEEDILPEGVTLDDFADEAAKPNAILIVRTGKLGSIKMDVDRELAAPYVQMMHDDIAFAQTSSGVTDELLGRETNATSGVAVKARQEQGSLATSKLFDNLRFAEQLRGELELSLIEQYVTEQKQFRITNQRGTPEFVDLNDGLPENDITRSKADFVISEADWRATMRQAAVDQLVDVLSKMPPEVGMSVLDLLIENMDLPNRDEIVKRVRSKTGMKDPDQTEPTPEEIAQQEQQALETQKQTELWEANLADIKAGAAKKAADADRVKAQTTLDLMNAAKSGMEAASVVIQMPATAKVADNLLAAAGWSTANPAAGAPAAPVAAQGIPPQAVQQPPVQPAPEAPQPQQGA